MIGLVIFMYIMIGVVCGCIAGMAGVYAKHTDDDTMKMFLTMTIIYPVVILINIPNIFRWFVDGIKLIKNKK